MEFIPYTQQSLNLEDVQAVRESLTQPWITRGPLVDQFEQQCAQFCQAKYAVAFNSGTNALAAAGYAVKLSAEDTLVTSPNTFVGTIAGALQKTQKLKLVDIDLATGCGQFDPIEKPHKGRLVIFPVHFAGKAPLFYRPFANSVIIEDACQAFGAVYKDGQRVGSCTHSDMTVFSFHPAKTICCGEGGLVTTNHKEYYERLKLYRNNGIIKTSKMDPWIYEVHDVTTNCNVMDFQMALGLSQFNRLETFINNRHQRAKDYRRLLNFDGISFLDESYDHLSAHNLMPVLFDFNALKMNRKEFMLKLKEEGVGTQVHFIPLYRHPYFEKNFQFNFQDFPNMELYYQQELSLPMFSHLTLEQTQTVCQAIMKTLDLAYT